MKDATRLRKEEPDWNRQVNKLHNERALYGAMTVTMPDGIPRFNLIALRKVYLLLKTQ